MRPISLMLASCMVILCGQTNASPNCMTLKEARAKWPTQHLWHHTAEKCWDNQAGRGRTYGKRENKPDLTPRPAPSTRADANGNLPKQRVLWPRMVPTIEFSFQSFINAEPMTLWPSILDIDEVTADPPECCWPKLDKDFEVRWNEMPAMWLAKLRQ